MPNGFRLRYHSPDDERTGLTLADELIASARVDLIARGTPTQPPRRGYHPLDHEEDSAMPATHPVPEPEHPAVQALRTIHAYLRKQHDRMNDEDGNMIRSPDGDDWDKLCGLIEREAGEIVGNVPKKPTAPPAPFPSEQERERWRARTLYLAMPGAPSPPIEDGQYLWGEIEDNDHWLFCRTIVRLVANATNQE